VACGGQRTAGRGALSNDFPSSCSTLHYTGPNQTATPRLARSLEFGPRRPLPGRLVAKARLVWRRGLPGPRQTGALAVAVCSRARRSIWSIFTNGTSTQASAVMTAEIHTSRVKPTES
jgi:hypothetical protein